jgi:hypothetical protein
VWASLFAGTTLLPLPTPPKPAGAGYVHSLPVASQARQVVLTPLLMHLTLLRRHRAQAIDDLIRGWSERFAPLSLGFPSARLAVGVDDAGLAMDVG